MPSQLRKCSRSLCRLLSKKLRAAAQVLGVCQEMLSRSLTTLDVKPQVFDEYVEEVNERMGDVVWETGGCNSWYMQDGKVVNNSPWAVSEMAWMLRKPHLEDFVVDGADWQAARL